MEDWWCPLETLSQSTLQPCRLQIPTGTTTTLRSEAILTRLLAEKHGTTRLHGCRSWETFYSSLVRQSTWQAQTPLQSSARTEVSLWIPPSTLQIRLTIAARCSLVASASVHNQMWPIGGKVCIKVRLNIPHPLISNIGSASCGTVAAVKQRPPIISIPSPLPFPSPFPPVFKVLALELSRCLPIYDMQLIRWFPLHKTTSTIRRESFTLRGLKITFFSSLYSYYIGPPSVAEMIQMGNDTRDTPLPSIGNWCQIGNGVVFFLCCCCCCCCYCCVFPRGVGGGGLWRVSPYVRTANSGKSPPKDWTTW